MSVVHSLFKKSILFAIVITLAGVSLFAVNIQAQEFNRNVVLKTNDLYSLPSKFGSAAKIQEFLVSTGSVLATTNVTIQLHKSGGNYPLNQTINYTPSTTYLAQEGQVVSVAEFIWRISRTALAAGCSTSYSEVCFNNGTNPINPGLYSLRFKKSQDWLTALVLNPMQTPTHPVFIQRWRRLTQNVIVWLVAWSEQLGIFVLKPWIEPKDVMMIIRIG
jgi:hypothetical protein